MSVADTRALFVERFELLRRDGLQYLRFVLAGLAALHLTLGIGRFLFDVILSTTGVSRELKLLDFLSIVLTIAARTVWSHQLRVQHSYLWFVRPSRAYRWAVYCVCTTTTLPAFFLHFPIIWFAAKTGRIVNNGVLQTKLQLASWVVTCAFYFYVVRKYMLAFEDDAYEPVAASPVEHPGDHGSMFLDVEDESATSTPASEAGAMGLPMSRLSLAYALQRATHRQHHRITTRSALSPRPAAQTEQIHSATAVSAAEPPLTSQRRCPTVALFDYVCPKKNCAHSLPMWPLVSVALLIFTIVPAYLAVRFAIMNRQLRVSSSYARYTILCPIGGLLLVAYSLKKRPKQSQFIRKSVTLSPRWSLSETSSGQAIYLNSDFESSSTEDPRLRVFPIEARTGRVNRIRSEYIKAYNANHAPCDDYWGHLGRQWNGSPRLRPLLSLLLRVGFAGGVTLAGLGCNFMYPVVKLMEGHLALPDLTFEDLLRMIAVQNLSLVLMATSTPLVLLSAILVLYNIASLPILWSNRNSLDESDKMSTSLPTDTTVDSSSNVGGGGSS